MDTLCGTGRSPARRSRFDNSSPTTPAFATATRFDILAPMTTLEINAPQPWLISEAGSAAEIIGNFGGADQLRIPMLNRQTTWRNHLRWTRDLLLPRVLLGQANQLTTITEDHYAKSRQE